MAYYAFLNEDNIVTEVIPGRDENDLVDGVSSWEEYYGQIKGQTCIRTSYNANIRKKYACVGDTYDASIDAFIPEKPSFNSWIFDQDTWSWEPPTPRPSEGFWIWDEESVTWVEVSE